MPTYRITFQFSGGGVGWSETHLYQNASTDFAALRPDINAVAQARAQMLGNPYFVYAARVAQYLKNDGTRAPRQVRLWKGDPAAGWGGWYNLSFGAAAWDSEPSNVACQALGYAGATAPAGYSGNSNQTFLGGAPDRVIDENGTVFPAQLGFQGFFNIWAGILAKANSGWGWGGAQTLGSLKILTITQNADGTVKFTVQAPIPVQIVVGTAFPARVRDVNQGRSPLNSECIVTRKADDSFDTREVIGIATAQSNGFLRVYSTVPVFIPYASIELALQSVKHKRGKSPQARPGRANRRIRG